MALEREGWKNPSPAHRQTSVCERRSKINQKIPFMNCELITKKESVSTLSFVLQLHLEAVRQETKARFGRTNDARMLPRGCGARCYIAYWWYLLKMVGPKVQLDLRLYVVDKQHRMPWYYQATTLKVTVYGVRPQPSRKETFRDRVLFSSGE